MTDIQLRELSVLQGVYYKAVEDNDQNMQRQQLALIVFYIRKQIWQEARLTILKVSLADFEAFDIGKVQLHETVLARFGDLQRSMLVALHERKDEGREIWAAYLDWVSDVIETNVSAWTSKYVKVIARQFKKR
jgi:methionine synthase II (cobalamin-independent)